MTPTTLWLIAAVVFIALEAFGLPGVGFVFVGIGALMTGGALELGWLANEAVVNQFILCFAGAFLSALLLWKPLQKMRMGNGSQGYSNMVGEVAQAGANGISKTTGEAIWSGTIMKARLADNAAIEQVAAGSQVVITDVVGATLIVKPK